MTKQAKNKNVQKQNGNNPIQEEIVFILELTPVEIKFVHDVLLNFIHTGTSQQNAQSSAITDVIASKIIIVVNQENSPEPTK